MTLRELILRLETLQAEGVARPNSPVIAEGHDENDDLVQACVDGVMVEARCEDEGEPPGVYLSLSEISTG